MKAGKPLPPGIYRGTKAGWIPVERLACVEGKWVREIYADAMRAGTFSPLREKSRGQPALDTAQGGVHLLFLQCFAAWLNKKPGALKQWTAIADRGKFFINLVAVAMLPVDSVNRRAPLAYCQDAAPELTPAALPLLRRRAKKITTEDYAAACSMHNPGTVAHPRKMSSRERRKRFAAKKAQKMFQAATE